MYPDRHHPIFMLQDALQAVGVAVEFAKDERTRDCWGMVFPDFNHRVMVWLIDNRHEHERAKEDPAAAALLAEGALVCHAQKPDYERVGGHWLPLAATPGFRPMPALTKVHDAAFIGFLRDMQRVSRLADVAAMCNVTIAWGMFGHDAVRHYNAARVGVNVPTRWGMPNSYDSWNMRLPELAACGIVPVTPHEDYLAEGGWLDGQTCYTYGTHRPIEDAVRLALDNPQVGSAAHELVMAKHTYAERAKQVMAWLQP